MTTLTAEAYALMVPPETDTVAETDNGVEYTIDELAAHTRVPSRTIRFYQSKGALQKPEIRGRKAIYSDTHVERLKLIGDLQDRGLRIRAIRDLVERIDSGELVLSEWLGLEARLQEPWAEDEPKLCNKTELAELVGDKRAGFVSELVRLDLVTEQGRAYLVESPALLRAVLQLHASGIDLEVAKAGVDLTRRHLGKLSSELVALYLKSAGDGFGGSGSAADLGRAFESLRVVGLETVQMVFAQEMQSVLAEMVKSGAAAKVAGRKKS